MGLGVDFGKRVPYKGFLLQTIKLPASRGRWGTITNTHTKVWKDDGQELVVVHRATNAAGARKWVDKHLANPNTTDLFTSPQVGVVK